MCQHFFGKQCTNIFLGNNGSAFFWEATVQHFFYPEKTRVGKFRCHSNICILISTLVYFCFWSNNSYLRFHALCSAVELYNKPYVFFAILKLDGSKRRCLITVCRSIRPSSFAYVTLLCTTVDQRQQIVSKHHPCTRSASLHQR